MSVDWIKQGLERTGRNQVQLAELLGLDPAAVSRLLKGRRQLKATEADTIRKWLETATEPEPAGPPAGMKPAPPRLPDNPPPDAVIPGARPLRGGPRSLPIYGAGQSGPEGFLNIEPQDAIDWTWMPAELQDVRGAFALYVDGDSMTDAGLPAGTLVHVHPHRRPRTGQNCVIVLRSSGVFIKRYVGQRGGKLVYEQSNPKKEGDFPLADVAALYLITSAVFP